MSKALSQAWSAHQDGKHNSPTRIAALRQRAASVRAFTLQLAAPLSPEDCAVQSMPDASPVKWHLAHTSWFFETFVLVPHVRNYQRFDERYAYLFNSYYEALGPRHPRPARGLLTRPALAEIYAYRRHVDAALGEWLAADTADESLLDIVELGLEHERQHQELLLTDIKHLLSQSPWRGAYRDDLSHAETDEQAVIPLRWIAGREGPVPIGYRGMGFSFDNEGPVHTRWLNPHVLASRAVSNAEYREFIRDGGYRKPALWLADGWSRVQAGGWAGPLYWDDSLDAEFTLGGMRSLALQAPVCHVSYYEADAYARWADARLPTEDEWEASADGLAVRGNFVDSAVLHPVATIDSLGFHGLYGDVWEWTGSAYLPYPGYAPAAGAVGEYNGKFMSGQMVLRGGSCVSHRDHLRPSYRNFFPPDARWQFSGLRLARSI